MILVGIANQIVGPCTSSTRSTTSTSKDVPEVPVVPHVSKFVWQQRITLVTFLYKTITDLPNNIRMTPTGMISITFVKIL